MKKFIYFAFLFFVFAGTLSIPVQEIQAQEIKAQEIKGNYRLLEGKTPPKAGSLKKVKVIEVLSFACPHCYDFNKNLPTLTKKYKDKVIWTHYPTGAVGINPILLYFISVKKNKGKQTKDLLFRAFHDSGIRNLNNKNVISALALELGLKEDYEKMKNDPLILEKIKFSSLYINKLGIRSTPSFIIENSILVEGASIKNIAQVIDSLLQK